MGRGELDRALKGGKRFQGNLEEVQGCVCNDSVKENTEGGRK